MLMQETCHDTICLLMSSQAQAACLLQLGEGPHCLEQPHSTTVHTAAGGSPTNLSVSMRCFDR